MPEINDAIRAQTAKTNEFLKKRNVVGVGVGFKNQLGADTGEPSVVVLVQQKKPIEALSEDDLIPREIDGLPTDVVEIGFMRAHQQSSTDRFRPVIPAGVSLAHYQVGAGTLGLVVQHRASKERLLLSNNHVLANANGARIGDRILQPAPKDGGGSADAVAQLADFRPLAYLEDAPETLPETPTPPERPTPPTQPTVPDDEAGWGWGLIEALMALANFLARVTGSSRRVQPAQAASQTATAQSLTAASTPAEAPVRDSFAYDNLMDVALARPTNPAMFSNEVFGIGPIMGTRAPELGLTVVKMGRTTGYTGGRITLLNATINVQYDTINGTRTARFVNQVITTSMSKPGDSGSLIVDPTTKQAVGLLFAGSEFASLFTPIDRIFSTFNLEIP